MGDNYEQEVRSVAVKLAELKSKFQSLQTGHSKEQLAGQTNLSEKSGKAMEQLKALAVHLDRDFNPSKPPAPLPSALERLSSAWNDADRAAEHCWRVVSSYSADVSPFHPSSS